MRSTTVLPLWLCVSSAFALSPPVRIADIELAPPVLDGYRSAMAPDGLLVTVWTDGVVTRSPIRIAVSSDRGLTWTAGASPGAGYLPQVRASAGGIIDVVWSDKKADPTGIFHARSVNSGVSWNGPNKVGIITAADLESNETRLAVSSGGTIAVVATQTGTIWFSRSTDGGGTWSPGISLDMTYVRGKPTLAWSGGNALVVCWTEYSKTPSYLQIVCRASANGGVDFGANVTVVPPIDNDNALVGELAFRPSGDFVLAYDSQKGGGGVVGSVDPGRTWGAPIPLPVGLIGRPSIVTQASGEVWIAYKDEDSEYDLKRSSTVLFHSADGESYSAVAAPSDLVDCLSPTATRPTILAAAAGDPVLADQSLTWRASAGAASWDLPVALARFDDPVQDVEVVRLTSNRVVAFWMVGTSVPKEIRSSVSDDGGLTWSAWLPANDQVPSLRDAPHEQAPLDAVALAGGGLVLLWLAHTPGACAELRSTYSIDGTTFAPSVKVGDFDGSVDGYPLSIAEDGSQRLVAVWLQGEDLVSSTSLDRATTWGATALVIDMNPLDLSGRIVAAPDGSLLVTVDGDGARGFRAFRTDDAARTWSDIVIDSQVLAPTLPALVRAGPRLVAMITLYGCDPGPPCWTLPYDYESLDSGRTWSKFGEEIPATFTVGDPAGNVYWRNQDNLMQAPPGAPSRVFDSLPAASVGRLLVWDVEKLSYGFADWTPALPPGVLFTPQTVPLAPVANSLFLAKAAASPGSIDLTWTDIPRATSYVVRQAVPTGAFDTIAGRAASGRPPGLRLTPTSEPLLFFRVAGENGEGEGPL